MPPSPMDKNQIRSALKALASEFDYATRVEITLVGGAALMLTGLVRPERVTGDCDIIDYLPGDAMAAVELAAERIAAKRGLDKEWLNSKVQIRLDILPDGWRKRRIEIEHSEQLWIYALSRPDLIATKIIANRPQDREDLEDLKVREDDVRFVEEYLNGLAAKGTTPQQIEDARTLLASLELREE